MRSRGRPWGRYLVKLAAHLEGPDFAGHVIVAHIPGGPRAIRVYPGHGQQPGAHVLDSDRNLSEKVNRGWSHPAQSDKCLTACQ